MTMNKTMILKARLLSKSTKKTNKTLYF